MTKRNLAQLIQEENSALAHKDDSALQTHSEDLFTESKALWDEFCAFEQQHQIASKVGAQLWRLTKAIGKPALILTLKGTQTAFVTLVNADKRAEVAERFRQFSTDEATDAALTTPQND